MNGAYPWGGPRGGQRPAVLEPTVQRPAVAVPAVPAVSTVPAASSSGKFKTSVKYGAQAYEWGVPL
eukprot:9464509-Heterocapsa_arctica.AAC.1